MENRSAAVLVSPLVLPVATPAAISTVTAPSAEGVIFAVNTVLSLVCRLPAAPLPTVISESVNPVTASLNVMVTGMGLAFVGLVLPDVIVTVGLAGAAGARSR